MGVILGQVLGAFVNTALRYMIGRKFIKLKIKWKKSLIIFIVYSIISFVVVKSNWMINIIIELATVLILIVTYNREIKKIINGIINIEK